MTKEEKQYLDTILEQVGKALVQTMRSIGAENFLECSYTDSDTGEKFNLKITKNGE